MTDNNGNGYLLDLSTTEDLPSVRIDGSPYAIRIDVEYSELLRLRDIGKRIQAVTEASERTEQEEAELRKLMRSQVRAVLKAPDEVLEKLTDLQRFRIVMAFNEQVGERLDPTKAASRTSRDSGGSTAAR